MTKTDNIRVFRSIAILAAVPGNLGRVGFLPQGQALVQVNNF